MNDHRDYKTTMEEQNRGLLAHAAKEESFKRDALYKLNQVIGQANEDTASLRHQLGIAHASIEYTKVYESGIHRMLKISEQHSAHPQECGEKQQTEFLEQTR